MARPATGNVRIRKTTRGESFEIRFSAYGKPRYQHLGTSEDGWTRERAVLELQNMLADIRRGIWKPPVEPEPVQEPRQVRTFHEFASEWFVAKKLEGGRGGRGLSTNGVTDLQWRLSNHLLPFFSSMRVDRITVEDVDRYRRAKVAEGQIGTTSINKTLTTLAAVLETAVEYGLIERNPAKGKRRRLPSVAPRRTWIDRADHIEALLDGASELDREARRRHGQRRALLATLTFAGLRLGEMLALRWRDVDLARGTLVVRASKTDAGVRTVDLLPVLRDELLSYRARLGDVDRDALVFGTYVGGRQSESNIRRRLLAPSIETANETLERAETELLPSGLTPHSLRRTFASLLVALGEDPVYTMRQLGHTDPTLTLRIYAQQMSRRDGERERLRALVKGADSGRNVDGAGIPDALPIEADVS